MADLAPVGSGVIRGKFVAGVLDSADPGSEPDIVPMTGLVKVVATTPYFRVTSTDPPLTVFPTELTIPLNGDGELEYNGSTDINLWATDDPDTNPTDWQWRVSFQLQFDGRDVAYPSFNFTLSAGEVKDLTTAAPAATPSPGVAITQGPAGDPGPSAYDIAVENGFVGTEADWLLFLEGADGSDGVDGKSLHVGNGAPGSGFGNDWDSYINEANGDFYVKQPVFGWVLESNITGPPGAGVKTYADAAAVNAVTTTEEGILAIQDLSAFFGMTRGMLQSYNGSVVKFRSLVTNGYWGGALPPAGNGGLTQEAIVVDGNHGELKLTRTRQFTAPSTWAGWSSWKMGPSPIIRPSAFAGYWRTGIESDGASDGWATAATDTVADLYNNTALDYLPSWWSIMAHNPEPHGSSSGRLYHKSAGFEFQGILDAARTDVGTPAWTLETPLTTPPAAPIRNHRRIEWTAAAAATDAVAGVSIPLELMGAGGYFFDAMFALAAGGTSTTRLLCGLAEDLTTAMTDADPSSLTNVLALGFDSDDTTIKLYHDGTGATPAPIDTAQTVQRTTHNQIINFRGFLAPPGTASSMSRVWWAQKTAGNTPTRGRFTGTIRMPWYSEVGATGFFLRASAGGTSAQPKVALVRLRVASGLDFG